MADPRRAITVVPSRAAITGDRAPFIEKYYFPLDYPAAYRFALADTSTADTRTTLVASGGPVGAWVMLAFDDIGADITATGTIQVGDGLTRYIQAAALSANIVITLGDTNARPGYSIEIVRLDTTVWTVTIVDGFSGGGTLAVMPVSVRSRFKGVVNAAGTHWLHRESHLML